MENIDFDSPKPSSHLRPAMFHPPPPPTTQYLDPEYLLEEINGMRRENAVQQMQIDQQAKELNQHRAQTSNNQDERERLKRKVRSHVEMWISLYFLQFFSHMYSCNLGLSIFFRRTGILLYPFYSLNPSIIFGDAMV